MLIEKVPGRQSVYLTDKVMQADVPSTLGWVYDWKACASTVTRLTDRNYNRVGHWLPYRASREAASLAAVTHLVRHAELRGNGSVWVTVEVINTDRGLTLQKWLLGTPNPIGRLVLEGYGNLEVTPVPWIKKVLDYRVTSVHYIEDGIISKEEEV